MPLPTVEARPQGREIRMAAGTAYTEQYDWSADPLAGRTFEATVDGLDDPLDLTILGDVMSITYEVPEDFADDRPGYVVRETTGGGDDVMWGGRLLLSHRYSQLPSTSSPIEIRSRDVVVPVSVLGPPGPQGPPGADGEPGAAGADGVAAATGLATYDIPTRTIDVPASAVQALITAAIDDLVDGAPGALDTLNELAAAVNDDASFAAAVTTALAGKQPLDSDLTTLSGGGAGATAWLSALLSGTYSALATPLAPVVPDPALPAPTIVSTFQSGHGFSDDGSGTNADDTAVFTVGTQSVKMTTDGVGGIARLTKIGATAVNYTDKQVELWMRFEDITKATNLALYLGTGGFASYYRFDFLAPDVSRQQDYFVSGEWAVFRMNWQDANVVGTPNRAAITDTRVSVVDASNGATNVWVNAIIARPTPKTLFPNGVVSFTFDDAYASQYTIALPILSRYGFPGTLHPIVDFVGDAGAMTVAQMREMQDVHGWEVGGHAATTDAHNNRLTSLSAPDLEVEMRTMKQWLVDNGFHGEDFAYPGGIYDANVEEATRRYFASGRTQFLRSRETVPAGDTMKIKSRSLGSTTSLALVQGYLTAAAAEQGWVNLTIHKLGPTSADSLTWSQTDFETIVAQAASAGMAVRTTGQVLAALSNQAGLQTALDLKLASSSYTAADVLAKLLTVDGAASGLDADLLDGIDSLGFVLFGAMGRWPSGSYLQGDWQETTGALTADRCYYCPLWVPEARTTSLVEVDQTGAGSGGTPLYRIGLHSPDANGRPGALLNAGSTVTAAGANGIVGVSISQALPRGLVWVSVVPQGATGTQPSVRITNTVSRFVNLTTSGSSSARGGYIQSGVTGAFPDPAVPLLTSSAAVPFVQIKAA